MLFAVFPRSNVVSRFTAPSPASSSSKAPIRLSVSTLGTAGTAGTAGAVGSWRYSVVLATFDISPKDIRRYLNIQSASWRRDGHAEDKNG